MIHPNLPFIDLHRHLDGSTRLETILDLGRKHNLPLPAWDAESLRPHVQVTDPQPGVMAFLAKYKWLIAVLVDYDACRRIAYENVEDLLREQIDYAELRFSPWFMAEGNGLNPQGVVEAVVDGVEAGVRDFGVPVQLIGILSRTYGPEICTQELQSLLAYKDHLVAVDLAGDEARFPARLFIDHFKKVRTAGLHVTIHAGEADGAESIRDAVDLLGAERIGHAVRAFESPAVIEMLRSRHIGIETNLTSNVQTSTVESFAAHPLRRFLEAGLMATINTDDPGISAITLKHEFLVAAPAAGLTRQQIQQAQANALETAFLHPLDKQTLLAAKKE
ncbi:MAG: adenosine deaminase [Bellilinea sp.]